MKIAVDIGHNCPFDGGAVGIGNENVMVMDIGNRLAPKLMSLGHEVIIVTPNNAINLTDSLAQRVNKANSWGADLYVSLHANSGGGVGTEIWIGSESSKTIANNILTNIVSLGFKNRGVKVQGIDGHGLYVLKNTNMPALLVESCFVDSTEDMAIFSPENMANAICKGITGQSVTLNGWNFQSGYWYCYEKGQPVKNTWRQDSKDWCYLDSDGHALVNNWARDSKGWCYCGEDCRIIRDKTITWNDKNYYFGKDGYWDGL